MAPDPTTSAPKVTLPSSLLDSDSSALPPNTRNALLAHLQESSSIPRLNTLLTDSLSRAGWTDRVHNLALELLRSGECVSFGEVLGQVSRRACSGLAPKAESNGTNGNGVLKGDANSGMATVDVKVPKEVVEKSVKFLRGEIEGVVEVVHDEKNGTNGVSKTNGSGPR